MTNPEDVLRQAQAQQAESTELIAWLRQRTVSLRDALEALAQQVDELTRERNELRAQLDQKQEGSA